MSHIYKKKTTTTTIISEGGRPASTRVVSPYGGPVLTGKPGIRLAPSRLGFTQSPLPALCRQASTCAWRSRLRRRYRTGGWDGSCGGHPWATLAAQTVLIRTHSGVLGRPWRPGRPRGGPRGSAEPSGDARKTLRTVWSGGHVCPETYESLYILNIE